MTEETSKLPSNFRIVVVCKISSTITSKKLVIYTYKIYYAVQLPP